MTPSAGVVARAEAAGCKAIVPLVNTAVDVNHSPPQIGFRPPAGVTFAHFDKGYENTSTNTWEYLDWLRSQTSLPIVPKGIMTADDAGRAVDAGVAGIIVSNHGGRQLQRSISTLDALADVVARRRGPGGGLPRRRRAERRRRPDRARPRGASGHGRPAGDVGPGRRRCRGRRPRARPAFARSSSDHAGLCGIADVGRLPADLVVDAAMTVQPMRVSAVRTVLVTSPWTGDPFWATGDAYTADGQPFERTAALVVVETDEGLSGLGEPIMGYFAPEVVGPIVDYYGRLLVDLGLDPRNPDACWRELYQRSLWWGRVGLALSVLSRRRDGALGHRRQGRRPARPRADRRAGARPPAALRVGRDGGLAGREGGRAGASATSRSAFAA